MIREILKNIIDNQYSEIENLTNRNDFFWKIKFLGANEVGKVGHNFLISILNHLNIDHNNQNDAMHDEFDLQIGTNRFEIKTARESSSGFQFNGVDPRYNYDYIFFISIKTNNVRFRIATGTDIYYNHPKRGHYIRFEDGNGRQKEKKVSPMNPGDSVNHKITFTWNQMKSFDLFESEIRSLVNNEEN